VKRRYSREHAEGRKGWALLKWGKRINTTNGYGGRKKKCGQVTEKGAIAAIASTENNTPTYGLRGKDKSSYCCREKKKGCYDCTKMLAQAEVKKWHLITPKRNATPFMGKKRRGGKNQFLSHGERGRSWGGIRFFWKGGGKTGSLVHTFGKEGKEETKLTRIVSTGGGNIPLHKNGKKISMNKPVVFRGGKRAYR